MVSEAVVALAAALVAGGRELPSRPTRYLVLWGGGPQLAGALAGHGVKAEVHSYWTTVGGRRYRRYKLVVRDERLTARLAGLAGDKARLSALMRRFRDVVLDVIGAVKRMAGWRKLLELVPASLLRRLLGIKPFRRGVYRAWRNRAIARHLKPDWRGWLFLRLRYGNWSRFLWR